MTTIQGQKELLDELTKLFNIFKTSEADIRPHFILTGPSGSGKSFAIAVVCFVDEFDKLFISGNSNSDLAHETTNGVQNEFLKVLESDQAAVYGDYGKYINISISNVLFVFAGAFNGEEDIDLDRLRTLGIKTEFLGRVGLVFNTQPLSLEDLYAVFEKSELLAKYLELFEDADKEQVTYSIKSKIQQLSMKS